MKEKKEKKVNVSDPIKDLKRETPSFEFMNIESVAVIGESKIVIINGQRYREGDWVNNMLIEKINPKNVTFLSGKTKKEGVFSWWKGQLALKFFPDLVNGTYEETKSTISTRLFTSSTAVTLCLPYRSETRFLSHRKSIVVSHPRQIICCLPLRRIILICIA